MAAARGAMEWVARWQQAHGPPQFRAANLSDVPRSAQTIPKTILQVGATAESALKKHEKCKPRKAHQPPSCEAASECMQSARLRG